MTKILNLEGQRFGRLVVVSLAADRGPGGSKMWHCQCDCGNTKLAPASRLNCGLLRSCGCLEKDTRVRNCTRNKHSDLVGQKFGRLTVIEQLPEQNRRTMWKCVCECGKEKTGQGTLLVSGKLRSCGCLKDELTAKRFTKHGATRGRSMTHEYSVNKAVVRRCRDPKHRDYPYYGGRGIQYDPRWEDHSAFLSDMGYAPTPEHTIERRDNDGHYCASNCYWATRKEQANNTSRNHYIAINGVTKTLAQWCEHYGAPVNRVGNRIRMGWDEVRALTQPKSGKGGRPPLPRSRESTTKVKIDAK